MGNDFSGCGWCVCARSDQGGAEFICVCVRLFIGAKWVRQVRYLATATVFLLTLLPQFDGLGDELLNLPLRERFTTAARRGIVEQKVLGY